MKSLTKLRSIGLCALAFWGMMTSGLIAFLPQFLFGSNLLTTILMAGLYIFLYYLFAKWLSRRLGMNLIQFRMTIAKPSQFWIATAIFLPLTVLLVLYLLGGKVTLTDDLITSILMGAIAAPIVEEMCFRGIMMQLLEQAFSRKVAILGPSVFFGLVHLLNGAVSPLTALQLLIAGTLVGSLFSLATLQTGSILSSILVHSLWNLFTSIFLFDNQSSLFGGEYGVDVSPIASLAYLVVILLSMIAHRKKAS
ncbi:lysostaphin resistance A-like protein [Streptococcus sp. 2022WUSS037]|uniref:lysostaphin resistance A-like protein n=1 Tax=Streptococcus sp. 2022WUSS037 TaxID=2983286 RepID=UPI003795B2E6